nr:MAG TPA: hypothetical protein [Caudoviricetes sp.]
MNVKAHPRKCGDEYSLEQFWVVGKVFYLRWSGVLFLHFFSSLLTLLYISCMIVM